MIERRRFDQLQELVGRCRSRRELMRCADFKSFLTEKISTRLSREKTLSLDVFDTLLLRNDKSEIRRFHEIAERSRLLLATSGEAGTLTTNDLLAARLLATQASYRASMARNGCREGHLHDIYRTLCRLLSLDCRYARLFVRLEIDYESENVSLNDCLDECVREFRDQGGRVILVSDMYMTARMITELLERLGAPLEVYGTVFSSADVTFSKRSGKIYKFIEAELGSSADVFLHIGDDAEADFYQARRQGWDALHLPISSREIARRNRDLRQTQTRLSQYSGFDVNRV